MIVRAHPSAEPELVDGVAHDVTVAGRRLGEPFLAEFERCVAPPRAPPSIGSPWERALRRLRRLRLRRFRSSIDCTVTSEALYIVALAHARRRPGHRRART